MPLRENSLFPISCLHANFLPAWSFIMNNEPPTHVYLRSMKRETRNFLGVALASCNLRCGQAQNLNGFQLSSYFRFTPLYCKARVFERCMVKAIILRTNLFIIRVCYILLHTTYLDSLFVKSMYYLYAIVDLIYILTSLQSAKAALPSWRKIYMHAYTYIHTYIHIRY